MNKSKIAILTGEKTTKTRSVADFIIKELGGAGKVDFIPVETAKASELLQYDLLIFGSATWFDGEVPFFWDEFIPDLERTDLKGKKVAIFGLGNKTYQEENFCDAIQILAEVVEESGAKIVGATKEFKGLPLDLDNEPDSMEKKVSAWLKTL